MISRYLKIWRMTKKYLMKGRWIDLPHTLIVIDFARRLSDMEGGDNSITIPASMLHDVGYSALSNEDDLLRLTTVPWIPPYSVKLKKAHLTEGAKIARMILEKNSYNNEKIEKIVKIVANHEKPDDTRNWDGGDINHAIVADADTLSRLTDFGIRCIVEEYGIKEEDLVRSFLDKQDEWFLTNSARLIAEEELRKLSAYNKLKGKWKR